MQKLVTETTFIQMLGAGRNITLKVSVVVRLNGTGLRSVQAVFLHCGSFKSRLCCFRCEAPYGMNLTTLITFFFSVSCSYVGFMDGKESSFGGVSVMK